MSPIRRCTRTACGQPAVATLTYAYADSTAVLGPLATYAEPHCYDLCERHSARLTAPRGWEIVRLDLDVEPPPPSGDDLEALADAVRDAARSSGPGGRGPGGGTAGAAGVRGSTGGAGNGQGRRGHLRVLRDPD